MVGGRAGIRHMLRRHLSVCVFRGRGAASTRGAEQDEAQATAPRTGQVLRVLRARQDARVREPRVAELVVVGLAVRRLGGRGVPEGPRGGQVRRVEREVAVGAHAGAVHAALHAHAGVVVAAGGDRAASVHVRGVAQIGVARRFALCDGEGLDALGLADVPAAAVAAGAV